MTGVDASSSASLAAYINTLTYTVFDKTVAKIVEGTYWFVFPQLADRICDEIIEG